MLPALGPSHSVRFPRLEPSKELSRKVTSPIATPPSVVLMRSLSEAGMFSPSSSQLALPAATNGIEAQKP